MPTEAVSMDVIVRSGVDVEDNFAFPLGDFGNFVANGSIIDDDSLLIDVDCRCDSVESGVIGVSAGDA